MACLGVQTWFFGWRLELGLGLGRVTFCVCVCVFKTLVFRFKPIVIDSVLHMGLALAFQGLRIGCTNNYCCKSTAKVAAPPCVCVCSGGGKGVGD